MSGSDFWGGESSCGKGHKRKSLLWARNHVDNVGALKLYLCLSTAAHIRFLLLLRFLEGYFPVLAGQAKLVVEDGAAQGRNSGGGESSVGESASETGVPANYRDDEAEVSCERRHEERAAVLRT